MLLGRGSVIGFQKCNVHTYRDANQVTEAGNVENPLLTLFGNVERSVAEVSHSTVFFPKEVRPGTSPSADASPHPLSHPPQPPALHSQPTAPETCTMIHGMSTGTPCDPPEHAVQANPGAWCPQATSGQHQ